MAEAVKDIKIRVSTEPNPLKVLRQEMNAAKADLAQLIAANKQGTSEFREAASRLTNLASAYRQVDQSVKSFAGSNRFSSARLLEMGENITVVVAGLSRLAAKLKDELFQGAEFGVLKDNFTEIEGSVEGAAEKLQLLRQASSGNLNEAEVIKYSNRMKLLGFDTGQTAKFLDIVERSADKVGTTFDEGNQAIQKFIISGRGLGLQQMGINIADVEAKMRQLTGATDEEIKKLDDETQQQLRTTAIIELYGSSLDKINAKQLDSADRLKSMQTALQNVKLEFGNTIAQGVLAFADSLGVTNKVAEKTITALGGIALTAGNILPVLASLKFAFPAAFAGALPIIGAVALQIGGLMLLVKSFTDSLPVLSNIGQFLGDVLGGDKSIPDAFKEGVKRFEEQNKKPITHERQKEIWDVTKEVERRVDEVKKEKELHEQIDKIKDSEIKKQKISSGHSKEKVEKEKENLNLVQQQLKTIETIEAQLVANAGYTGAEIELKKQLIEAQERLLFLTTGTTQAEQMRLAMLERNKALGTQGIVTAQNSRGLPVELQGADELLKEQLDAQKEARHKEIETASQIPGYFAEALGYVMEVPKEMQTVVSILSNFIQGLAGGGSGIFGLLGNLAMSFIPGGNLIKYFLGGANGGSRMPSGDSMNFNPIINVPKATGGDSGGDFTFTLDMKELGVYNFMKKGNEILQMKTA